MKQQLNLPTKSHQGIIRLNMLKIQSPKKHCTKYHLTDDSTKNTSTPFSTPQKHGHIDLIPPGHLVFPQPDTASREAKNTTAKLDHLKLNPPAGV